MQRIIQEDEPPKPSTRVSSIGDQVTVIAKRRKVTAEKLQITLRGDPDLIVMKALEKDRTRRYETPSSLANDVDCYLRNLEVTARAPSRIYQLQKFVRRNRSLVAAGSLFMMVLLLGIVATTLGLVWARAKESRLSATLQQQREEEVYYRSLNEATAAQLDAEQWGRQAADLEIPPDRVEFVLGVNAFYRGDLENAAVHIDEAITLDPKSISANAAAAS